jgi:hypothetical protein
MKDYAFDIIDALHAPIITFSPHWADTIPKRVLNVIQQARLIALLKGEQMASYPECVVYLYTRSLEAPMDNDWSEIYMHISCATLETWFGEKHWEEVKAPRELSGWLSTLLNDLRLRIYERRRQVLKGRMNA